MKKRKVVWMTLLSAGILAISGCGENTEKQIETEVAVAETNQTESIANETIIMETEAETEVISGPITFTDDLGREVTVEHPERVVTMIGSFTDIWYTAGGEVVATVNDSWESFDLPLAEGVVNLGKNSDPDVEQLIASEPDLVIASARTDADVELEEVLTNAGINVVYFDVPDFEGYLHMLDICTDITGRKDLYEENGVKIQENIETIKTRADESHPTVLFLRASSSNVKARGSEGSVGSEILADLGCINIADSEESLLEDLSMEAIIANDPDYIFVTIQGTDEDSALQNVEDLLKSNPAWNSLTAVQNNRYYVLDRHLYNLKPNAKWDVAYQQLADIIYEE